MSAATVTPIRKAAAAAEVWLSPLQVCERVPGITAATLQDMRKRGVGPRYFKPTHKTVIYSAADIDGWVANSVVSTRDDR
jgi:hypothetical protein